VYFYGLTSPPMTNRFLFLLAPLLLFSACKSDRDPARGDFEIVARMDADPDRLHPMLTTVAYATDILRMTHFPLLEYHPITLELQPILAAQLPTVTNIDTGMWAGGQAFAYEIRPEATWDDGTPITAADYIFTLKAAFHPLVKANAWRGFLSLIKDVIVDPANPKKFTVLTGDNYFLSLPVTGNFNLYPRHKYDPNGFMDHVTLLQLGDPAIADSLVLADERLVEFATLFTTDQYGRDTAFVSGSGPYRLSSWTTGEEILLERKTNWWGDEVEKSNEQFIARPGRIRYKIIPDDQAALTLLRDGGLDVMGGVSPNLFAGIQKDSLAGKAYETYLAVFMKYVSLALNNHNPKLSDARTRNALAHVIDMDATIKTVMLGLGERIIGPFHPSKPYYNKALKPLAYDPAKARQLLKEAGWADSNGDGTVDRIIDGKKVELQLTLLLSPGSDVGQNIGLLLQKGGKEAGMDIKVETKDFKLILGDMAQKNYDMTIVSPRQSPADDDPYQVWHSDSDRPDGSNRVGYNSPVADSLILAIRDEKDNDKRYDLYKAFQKVLYQDQPAVFLYAPKEPVICRKAIKGMIPSPMRPGYYLPFLYL
jgi:ABC-type transport system substrate-binding protein